MEDLESLSNEEIRKKLIDLGLPVIPVTPTTRRVILKKIQRNLEQQETFDTRNEAEVSRSRTKSPGRKSPKSQSPGRSQKSHSPGRSQLKSHSPIRQPTIHPVANSTMLEPEPIISPQFRRSPIEILKEETNASYRLLQEMRNQSPIYSNDHNITPTYRDVPFMRKSIPGRVSARPGLGTPRLKDDIKESDDEDSPTTPVYAKFSQGPSKGYSITHSRGHPKVSAKKWFSIEHSISGVLLIGLLSFFVLLGITYLNMHSTEVGVELGSDLEFPVCGGEGTHTPCILPRDQRVTMRIFKVFYSALNNHLLSLPCTSSLSSIYFLNSEITQIILDNDKKLSIHDVELNLKNMKVLLGHNPKLNIETDDNGFLFKNPPVTYFCSLFIKMYIVGVFALKLTLIFLVIFFGYLIVRWWFKRKAMHKEEVNKLAMQIIDLISSACQGPDGIVPIIHVRDQLLSLEERKRNPKLWPDAVELLNGDSRLRTEVQTVEGENVEVWRWLAAVSSSSGKRKTWQGQAFDTIEGSMNALPDSPTPCLKIRHMFDAEQEEGEDWVTTVVDAILEKCGKAKVLHVVVDRQSREGCVYIKCASTKDAGIAYRSLHGSWFDGKLITVKYIREKRYLERFPDSNACTHPLRPSTS